VLPGLLPAVWQNSGDEAQSFKSMRAGRVMQVAINKSNTCQKAGGQIEWACFSGRAGPQRNPTGDSPGEFEMTRADSAKV
jgi:hypothetical protein